MKYKLAIFDMDGTILDTLEDLTDSVNYALTQCGYPARSGDEIKSFLGDGVWKLIERAAGGNAPQRDIDTIHDTFAQYYPDNCAIKTRPYEGIESCIDTLRKAGCITAVVSNKDDIAVKKLSDQYFPDLFDISLGRRDGIPRKPSPDSVNEVLSKLGIDRKDAVYIGDSEVDLATAENAHMDAIIVTWGFREEAFLKKHGAKLIVRSPDEITKQILG